MTPLLLILPESVRIAVEPSARVFPDEMVRVPLMVSFPFRVTTPEEDPIVSETMFIFPVVLWLLELFKVSDEPEAPVICPKFSKVPVNVAVVELLMASVFPAGIFRVPPMFQLPPVVNEDVFELLLRTNVPDVKLEGEDPEPSSVLDQLEVRFNALGALALAK
jgi:hypothetical protein